MPMVRVSNGGSAIPVGKYLKIQGSNNWETSPTSATEYSITNNQIVVSNAAYISSLLAINVSNYSSMNFATGSGYPTLSAIMGIGSSSKGYTMTRYDYESPMSLSGVDILVIKQDYSSNATSMTYKFT